MTPRAPSDAGSAPGPLTWADPDPAAPPEAPDALPSTYAPRRAGRREAAPPAPPEDTRPPAPAPAEPPPPPHRRRPVVRVVRALSTVLVLSGVLLVGDAIATVTWQEPVTALLSGRQQDALGGDLRRLEAAGPTPIEARALSQIDTRARRLAFRARSLKRKADDGQAIGRLRMPKLGTSQVVVMGTDTGDLKKGPGFYSSNPLPGVSGTVAIAGHRTTYGAPFRHVDRLKPGNTIVLQMPYATFTYVVERTRIVAPSEVSVLERRSTNRLVLTACHPLFSAAQRIVVSARLERTTPRTTT